MQMALKSAHLMSQVPAVAQNLFLDFSMCRVAQTQEERAET